MAESYWQININRAQYSQPVDMVAIRAACAQWLVSEQVNNRGDEGEFVNIRLGYVGVAVDAINVLGYTTDEDEESTDRDKIMDELGF